MPGKDGNGPPTGRGNKTGRLKCSQPGTAPVRKKCLTSKKRRATRRTVPGAAPK